MPTPRTDVVLSYTYRTMSTPRTDVVLSYTYRTMPTPRTDRPRQQRLLFYRDILDHMHVCRLFHRGDRREDDVSVHGAQWQLAHSPHTRAGSA